MECAEPHCQRYVDPTGREIDLSEIKDPSERKQIFEMLSKLTDDELSMDENGTMNFTESSEVTRKNGTELVRALILSSEKIRIMFGSPFSFDQDTELPSESGGRGGRINLVKKGILRVPVMYPSSNAEEEINTVFGDYMSENALRVENGLHYRRLY